MWSLARLENALPHWFENTQLSWVQWIYAFWQFLRGNPLALLVLSFLQFYVRQKLKKRNVVVVGGTKDIDKDYSPGQYQVVNMEIESYGNPPNCYMVKHNGYFYITHENNMCQLSACNDLYGEDVIFVERLLAVSGSLAVGRLLSQTEAYEKVMSKRYYLSRGPKYVVPTCIDYFDYSSKFWGILSTIPILLQARNYNKSSTLLSLVIIFLDIFRGKLYKLYDWLFNRLTRFVKLNFFKERTYLYDLFSMFSNRWRYGDTIKKHAYLAKPGEEMTIMWNCKLKSLDDIKILDSNVWNHDPTYQNIFMALYPESSNYTADCSVMQYTESYSRAVLRKPVYVP